MKIRAALLTLATGVAIAIAGPAVPTQSAAPAADPVGTIANSAHLLAATDGQDPWPKP